MDKIAFINHIKQRNQFIIDVIHLEFLPLNNRQLSWKPDSQTWNITECIHHLSLTLSIYIPQFERFILQEKHLQPDLTPYSPRWFASWMIRQMRPANDGTIRWKMPTIDILRPKNTGNTLSPDDVLARFLKEQAYLIELAQNSMAVDINRKKIKTAFGKLLTLTIGEAMDFITAHSERHLFQARKLTYLTGFPQRK